MGVAIYAIAQEGWATLPLPGRIAIGEQEEVDPLCPRQEETDRLCGGHCRSCWLPLRRQRERRDGKLLLARDP